MPPDRRGDEMKDTISGRQAKAIESLRAMSSGHLQVVQQLREMARVSRQGHEQFLKTCHILRRFWK
jgi:hypothetical protein